MSYKYYREEKYSTNRNIHNEILYEELLTTSSKCILAQQVNNFFYLLLLSAQADGNDLHWINQNFDLMVVWNEKSGDHQSYYNSS